MVPVIGAMLQERVTFTNYAVPRKVGYPLLKSLLYRVLLEDGNPRLS